MKYYVAFAVLRKGFETQFIYQIAQRQLRSRPKPRCAQIKPFFCRLALLICRQHSSTQSVSRLKQRKVNASAVKKSGRIQARNSPANDYNWKIFHGIPHMIER